MTTGRSAAETGGGGSPARAAPGEAEIRAARTFLADHLPATSLLPAPALSRRIGRPVRLKLETELPTGSFKVRGALWALARRLEEGEVGEVVASSTGNHGAAVAWAADRLGVAATVFLPADPNPVKRRRIEELGARIVEEGGDLAEAGTAASAYAGEREGRFLLDDATDPHLPAGPATLALEALERAPGLDAFVVPVGDSALVRGVAAAVRALRPGARIVGVQAEGAPAYADAWRTGEARATPAAETVADGLATRTPVADNVAALRRLVDDMVLVSDREMLEAIRRLAREEGVVAEPAGAAAVAALLAGAAGPGDEAAVGDGPVCAPVTGGNVTAEVLEAALAAGGDDAKGGDADGPGAGVSGRRAAPRDPGGSRRGGPPG